MKKLFAFLALLFALLIPAQSSANVYYLDATARGWSQAYMFLQNEWTNNSQNPTRVTGVSVNYKGIKLWKFETNWTDVTRVVFSDNTGYSDYKDMDYMTFGDDRVGVLKSSSTGAWKLDDNYVYTISAYGNNVVARASYSSYAPNVYYTGFSTTWNPNNSSNKFTYDSATQKFVLRKTVGSTNNSFTISLSISSSSTDWDNGFNLCRLKASGNLDDGVSRTLSKGSDNIVVPEAGEYDIIVDLINMTIKAESLGFKPSKITLPVFPAGITSKADEAGWTAITASRPVVYLCGNSLNRGVVTPEYQMEYRADGKYHLDGVALRPDWDYNSSSYKKVKVWVKYYTSYDATVQQSSNYEYQWSTDPIGKLQRDSQDGSNDIGYIGERVNVTYDPSSKTITITKAPEQQVTYSGETYTLPPFMSLVGDFKQKTQYNTPCIDDRSGTNTSQGWQEAWIQYNKFGPLKALNGNVMYNTFWPPRHDIGFYGQANGNEITFSSANITFEATRSGGSIVAKTGSQWKSELKAADSQYKNLNLVDGDVYVRYVVNDVWVLGNSKIWTGWNGGGYDKNGSKLADWRYFASWGYGDDKDNATAIAANTTYTATWDGGNFKFSKPTYFKTFEFFYCIKSGSMSEADCMAYKSVMYTTNAFCEASIQAQAVDNTYGQYKISFNKAGVDPTKALTWSVVRYNANVNMGSNNPADWQPVNVMGGAVTRDGATILKGTTTVSGFDKAAQWLNDGSLDNNLADGNYFYVFYFTIDGKEYNAKSNMISIYHPDAVPTVVRVYQILESLVDDTEIDIDHNHEYYGYDHETGRILGLNANDDYDPSTFTVEDFTYCDLTDKIDLSLLANCVWTPRFLVYNASTENEAFNDLFNANITNFNVMNNPVNQNTSDLWHDGAIIINGSYDSTDGIENATIENVTRQFEFTYSYTKPDGTDATATSTPMNLAIQPILPAAKIMSVTAQVTDPEPRADGLNTLALQVVIKGQHPNTTSRNYNATITLGEPFEGVTGVLTQQTPVSGTGSTDPVDDESNYFTITLNNVHPEHLAIANGYCGLATEVASTVFNTGNKVYERPATADLTNLAAVVDAPTNAQAAFYIYNSSTTQTLYLKSVSCTDADNNKIGTDHLPSRYYRVRVVKKDGTEVSGVYAGSSLDDLNMQITSAPREAGSGDAILDAVNCVERVEIEHAYLFEDQMTASGSNIYEVAISSPSQAPAYAPLNSLPAALYSAPAVFEVTNLADITTGLIGLSAESALDYEINGMEVTVMNPNVVIYNATGMVVAAGQGTYNLGSGIYVITGVNGAKKYVF